MRVLAVALLLGFGMLGISQETKPPAAKPAPDFQKEVVPIFEAKCLRCHGTKQKAGGLDMRTIPAMTKGGVSGPALIPGKSDMSIMVDMMHYNEMPPKKEKQRVTKEELAVIKAWIDAGATEGKK